MFKTHWACGILFLLATTCCFAAGLPPDYTLDRQEDSPEGDIVIEYYYSNSDYKKQIWLAPKSDPSNRVQLFEYGRFADVLMAPNEQMLVINDFPTTSGGGPLLYKRTTGLQFQEVANENIGEKAFNFFVRETHLPPRLRDAFDHFGIRAFRWATNSRAMLLSLGGHGNTGGVHVEVDSWLCVYDVDSRELSLNLRAMNRKTLSHD
jgi:hypothetical protein